MQRSIPLGIDQNCIFSEGTSKSYLKFKYRKIDYFYLRGGMPPVLARSWHGQHVGFACGAKSVDFAATANN